MDSVCNGFLGKIRTLTFWLTINLLERSRLRGDLPCAISMTLAAL